MYINVCSDQSSKGLLVGHCHIQINGRKEEKKNSNYISDGASRVEVHVRSSLINQKLVFPFVLKLLILYGRYLRKSGTVSYIVPYLRLFR